MFDFGLQEARQQSYEYYRDFTNFGYPYPMLEELKDRPPKELRVACIEKYLALLRKSYHCACICVCEPF